MPELTPELARQTGVAKELIDSWPPDLKQGDLVIVRCDDGIERVGHFAIVDTYPYWTVFPMGLTIPLRKPRKAHR